MSLEVASRITAQKQETHEAPARMQLSGDPHGAKIQDIRSQVLPGAYVTASRPRDLSMGNGHLEREEQMVDARAGLLFRGQRGPGARVTVRNLVPSDGIHLVAANSSEAIDPRDYLAHGMDHAKVTLHTNAKSGPDDVFRSIELKKKGEDGEKVSDTERQDRDTQKFAEIKHFLCLGKDTPASYSATWHTIEVFIKDRNGNIVEIRSYNLYKKEDVKRLLEWRDGDASPENIENVIRELNDIRDTLKSKEYLGIEVRKFPILLQDLMGEVNGPAPFGIASQALCNAANDAKSHIYSGTMVKRGLVTENKRRGRSSTYTLTPKGKAALKQMHQVRILQDVTVKRYEMELRRKQSKLDELEALDPAVNHDERREMVTLRSDITTLTKTRDEFRDASTFVMDFLLMELNGDMGLRQPRYDEHGELVRDTQTQQVTFDQRVASGANLVLGNIVNPEEEGITAQGDHGRRLVDERRHDYVDLVAGQVADDMGKAIVHVNKPYWRWKDPHELATEEQRFAAKAGSQLYDLLSERDSLDPVRIRKTDFLNRHGVSDIPKTDHAVDFLLHAILNPQSGSCRHFQGNPLMEQSLHVYKTIQDNPRFAWDPPDDHQEAAKSLKGLDQNTSDLISQTMRNRGVVPPEPLPLPQPSLSQRLSYRHPFSVI